ncbi:hypothetical protein GJ496_004371 [Pomphorhynchus laevis]|nr:hypothetical protein GJ496_004371 [Pomphorhynchus laevis]
MHKMFYTGILSIIRAVPRLNVIQLAHIQRFSIKRGELPPIEEFDLVEKFVKGDGPGGQSVNKTINAVYLYHKPTGLHVKCHLSRSLIINRVKARSLLQEKIDLHLNGENSYLAKVKEESRQYKREKKARSKQRLAELKQFKEREGIP